jgi:hypothetical protein
MSRESRRRREKEAKRQFGKDRLDLRAPIEKLHRSEWAGTPPPRLASVWTSTSVMVQAYTVADYPGAIRLSVNRHDCKDGLTWDDLAFVLHACMPGAWAVEVFPPADAVHNVANMRHLWVYPEGRRPPFELRGRS